METGPRAVALGGGHGLAASLSALRQVTGDLTAIVTVADDGGSSGRLRRDYGVLPPGDLRMALAALCRDDEWGTTWSKVVQHRFGGDRELAGHAVGIALEGFGQRGRHDVLIAVGCTGGKHRSVVMAEQMAARLSKTWPGIQVAHRDLGRE